MTIKNKISLGFLNYLIKPRIEMMDVQRLL